MSDLDDLTDLIAEAMDHTDTPTLRDVDVARHILNAGWTPPAAGVTDPKQEAT